jgi:hypothetical protein
MQEEQDNIPTEQELSEGELVDQDPLEPVPDPASRLAGNNQIPDFGDDVEGTLQDLDA